MKDKDFQKTFISAQRGDIKALEELIDKFMPCMIKNSYINGKLDSDCLQEITIRFITCIYNFKFDIKEERFNFIDFDFNGYYDNEK